tara:strand:+ start:143 stop:529 length:387 start_codon:yes stop_codon:yes gene_type:complete
MTPALGVLLFYGGVVALIIGCANWEEQDIKKSNSLFLRKFFVLLFLGLAITCFLNLFFDGLQYLVFGNYIDPSDTLQAGVGGTKAGLLRYLFILIFKIYPWFSTISGGLLGWASIKSVYKVIMNKSLS